MSDGMDLDGLAAKIAKALGRTRAPLGDDDDDTGRGPPRSVPYHRFREERDARKALRAELEQVKGQVAELSQGYESRLSSLQEETAAQVKGIGLRHEEDIRLIDTGLTDKIGRDTLRSVWAGLPKDSRGKSPSEWWSGQVEAQRAYLADPKAAEPPTVARPLTPYLPAEAPAKQSQGGGASGPPGGPQPRQHGSIESIPVDQGLDAFIAGLSQLG